MPSSNIFYCVKIESNFFFYPFPLLLVIQ